MNITTLILAKNEEYSIHLPINSVKDFVDKIIVADDFSTDKTVKMAVALGAEILRCEDPVSEVGFAEAVNRLLDKIDTEWVLILDADEKLSKPYLLHDLTRYQNCSVWALPRRKWFDYEDGKRIEYESYPDWQPKFFKNCSENRFVGEMHVRFIGPTPKKAYRGPHIEHLQIENRTKEKILHRKDLYKKFANMQGVNIHGGDLKIKVASLEQGEK